jgi:hypothetical protein
MSADDVCCNIAEPDTPHITLSGSSQRFNMPCLAILVFNGPLWVDGWAKDEDATMQGSFSKAFLPIGAFTRSLAWSAIVGFGQLPCANLVSDVRGYGAPFHCFLWIRFAVSG